MNLLLANKRKRADLAIIANKEDKEEFLSIINDIITNDTVKQMKNYIQHCDFFKRNKIQLRIPFAVTAK